MSKISALIFDFGGTLDGNGIHWLERTYQFIKTHHPEISREEFDMADKAAVTEFAFADVKTEGTYQEGSMLPVGVAATDIKASKCNFRETVDAIGTGIFTRLELSEVSKNEYVEWFCIGAEKNLTQNREWLQTLYGKYKLGVISNNFGNTEGWCNDYQLTPLLDVIVDSTVLGISKPDPGIFESALSELQISPEESIYIGDSYKADMVGAKGIGMWTAWMVGNQQKECLDLSVVDVQLSHLHELTDFLSTQSR
ncbi:HAD family hydrolase [Candidatus Poribacteria bacterium]|nr:HAD family hydrolase [Candidatus Poribacteria bacterium]